MFVLEAVAEGSNGSFTTRSAERERRLRAHTKVGSRLEERCVVGEFVGAAPSGDEKANERSKERQETANEERAR